MPMQHTDANGRVVEGITTHIWGGAAIGCFLILVLAAFGALTLVGMVLALVLA